MLAVYGQGFLSLRDANHRWASSLGAIDRPHKTESITPPKASAASPFGLGTLFPPVSLLLSTMHISDQAWMSGGAWELLISGSVLAVSCLRIHTNKGQRSHATGLTRPVFLSPYLHLSAASRRSHTRTLFFVRSSLTPYLRLSLRLTFGAA